MKNCFSKVWVLICCTVILAGGLPAAAAADSVYLSDITYQSYENRGNLEPGLDCCHRSGQPIEIAGNVYDKGIGLHPKDTNVVSEVVYDVSGYSYEYFTAVAGKVSDAATGLSTEDQLASLAKSKVRFYILVDDEVKADSGAVKYGEAYRFVVNMKGARKLTLRLSDGGDGIFCDSAAFAEAKLCNMTVKNIFLQQAPVLVYRPGQSFDVTGGKIAADFGNGMTELVDLTDSMISGYQKDAAGRQTVTITYKNKKTTFFVYVTEAQLDVTALDMTSWSVLKGSSAEAQPERRPGINTPYHAAGKITIADIEYEKGFGIHPAGSTSPAEITFSIEGLGYTHFYAVAGKDKNSGKDVGETAIRTQYQGKFEILLDGEAAASSPVMLYGEAYAFIVLLGNAKTLTLRATDGGDGISCDSSSFGNPILFHITEAVPPLTMPDPTVPDETNPDSGALLCAAGCLFVICTAIPKKRRL